LGMASIKLQSQPARFMGLLGCLSPSIRAGKLSTPLQVITAELYESDSYPCELLEARPFEPGESKKWKFRWPKKIVPDNGSKCGGWATTPMILVSGGTNAYQTYGSANGVLDRPYLHDRADFARFWHHHEIRSIFRKHLQHCNSGICGHHRVPERRQSDQVRFG